MRMRTTINLLADEGVERAGPGRAPTAFRIWKAGDNPTDKGETRLTPRSLSALLEQQGMRGNLFSIDVDHMSLSETAPPEARKAVGWHRLEERDGELWAVDVEWTDVVLAGLEKTPPEWRYFSPAYEVDKKTREVTAYMNTALTNNPATWNVTALATRAGSKKECTMTKEQARAALLAMAGDDEEKKKEIDAMLTAFGAGDGDGDEGGKKDEEKKGDGEKKDAEEPPPAASDDEKKKDEEKKDAIASRATAREAELLKQIGEQGKAIAELQRKNEETERASILASRKDLDAKQVEYLSKQPIARVRELLAFLPPAEGAGTTAKIAATRSPTRGESQVGDGGTGRAPQLPEAERAELDERMGMPRAPKPVRWEKNALVFGVQTPEQARERIAARAKTAASTAVMKGGAK